VIAAYDPSDTNDHHDHDQSLAMGIMERAANRPTMGPRGASRPTTAALPTAKGRVVVVVAAAITTAAKAKEDATANGKGKGGGGGGNPAMRLQSPYDIPTTAIQSGMFTTLVTALTATGLVAPLSSPKGPFTVFAPTDAAFAALPDGLVACLLNDLPTLQTILMYHIAKGQVLSSQLSTGQKIRTVQGENVEITVYRTGQVLLNMAAEVTTPDLTTRNGVIHVIDDVLVPPSIDVTQYLNTCSPE